MSRDKWPAAPSDDRADEAWGWIMYYPCYWCGEPLTLTTRGWVHQAGGAYVMRCPDCRWCGAPYPSPARCPQCGSRELRDDHCALAAAAPAGPLAQVEMAGLE